jgi:signal transduction histidine kinase/HAMP domain-containing protein
MKINSIFILGSNALILVLVVILASVLFQVLSIDSEISELITGHRQGINHLSTVSDLLTRQIHIAKRENAPSPVLMRVKFYELGERIENLLNQLDGKQFNDEISDYIEELNQLYAELFATAISFLDRSQLPGAVVEETGKLLEQYHEELNSRLFFLVDKLVENIDSAQNRYSALTAQIIAIVSVFLLLVVGYGVFLTWFTRKRILAPLNCLSIALEKISTGDYSQRVDVKTAREIQGIISSFNLMSNSLEVHKSDLQRKNRELQLLSDEINTLNLNLEQKVNTRSRDLIEVQDYLKQIIYSAPVPIAIFTSGNFLIDCNLQFCSMVGKSERKDIIGLNAEQLDIPDSKSISESIEKAFSSGAIRTNPQKINNRWFNHNFCPIVGIDGKTEEVMVFSEEVTDLITSKELIKRKNDELQEFVYSISHDLKSPLFSLRGFLTLLRDKIEKEAGEDQVRILKKLDSSINEVEIRITDLLELSRISALEKSDERVNIGEIVKLSVLTIRAQFNKPDYKLKIDDIPEIFVNRSLMEKLFDNLISNSFKYRQHDRTLKITIGHKQEGNRHYFTYEDNGTGINPDDLDHIFKVFYRAAGVKGEGSGVGLALVKKIIESLNGSIAVESVKGKYTSFKFNFLETNNL